MTKNQLEALRDIFNEWDDAALLSKVTLKFEDISRTATVVIEDLNEDDYGDLKNDK